MPKRIQMTRQRPWRHEHPDAVIVARPGPWGNPFRCAADPQRAVDAFRSWLTTTGTFTIEVGDGLTLSRVPDWWEPGELRKRLPELAGRDLGCWCPLDQPRHADVLLELSNEPQKGTRNLDHGQQHAEDDQDGQQFAHGPGGTGTGAGTSPERPGEVA